jgi:hypothetical protein
VLDDLLLAAPERVIAEHAAQDLDCRPCRLNPHGAVHAAILRTATDKNRRADRQCPSGYWLNTIGRTSIAFHFASGIIAASSTARSFDAHSTR